MQALKLVVDELKQLIVRVGGQLFGPFSDKIPVCSDKQDTATPPSYMIRPKITWRVMGGKDRTRYGADMAQMGHWDKKRWNGGI